MIHFRGIESVLLQNGKTERKQLPPDRFGQIRIPNRIRHHKRAEDEKWGDHFEDFLV
jgi:hypothetical protein